MMNTRSLIPLLVMPAALMAESVIVDLDQRFQVMDGFGTCTVQWNDEVEALYGEESFQDIYVDEMGNSIVRYEIPASMEPSVVEDWQDIDRSTWVLGQDHLDAAAALQFVKDVYEKAPEMKIVGSVWSPPGWMKFSGHTRGEPVENEKELNKLDPQYYTHFAKYLAEWVLWFEETYEVPMYAISIQNEPMFWEPYNSCVYTKEEYRDVIKEVGAMLEDMNVDVKLFGPEHMTHLYGESGQMIKAVMDDPEASQYLDIFAAHGYTDGIQSDQAPHSVRLLSRVIAQWDRSFWMSETSGEDPIWTNGDERLGALDGLAAKIHNALVYGNTAGWIYWQITDVPTAAQYALMNMDSHTPKSRVHMHYSKFIRPGAQRVAAETSDEGTLEVSAFAHDEDRSLTLVALNRSEAPQDLEVKLPAMAGVSTFTVYRSNASDDFAQVEPVELGAAGRGVVSVPARSIVTLTTDGVALEDAAQGWKEAEVVGWRYYYGVSEWSFAYPVGFYYSEHEPWVWLPSLGWTYAMAGNEGKIWLYSLSEGFLFVTAEEPGVAYHHGDPDAGPVVLWAAGE